jgi:hypothetical protein
MGSQKKAGRKGGREGGTYLGALAADGDTEGDNAEGGSGVDQVGGRGGGTAGHHVYFLREGREEGRDGREEGE